MRIGWVGGLDRNDTIYEKMAASAGHTIEFHNGRTGSRLTFSGIETKRRG